MNSSRGTTSAQVERQNESSLQILGQSSQFDD